MTGSGVHRARHPERPLWILAPVFTWVTFLGRSDRAQGRLRLL